VDDHGHGHVSEMAQITACAPAPLPLSLPSISLINECFGLARPELLQLALRLIPSSDLSLYVLLRLGVEVALHDVTDGAGVKHSAPLTHNPPLIEVICDGVIAERGSPHLSDFSDNELLLGDANKEARKSVFRKLFGG